MGLAGCVEMIVKRRLSKMALMGAIEGPTEDVLRSEWH